MLKVDIKQLLEAGIHFGHQTRRWNPKMEKYIFGERNGIYIIDLEKTMACLEEACEFLKRVASEGKMVLFVGTKKQAQEAIERSAKKCEMPYVNLRWLGGMLTNFETVRKSVAKLESLEKMEAEGTYQFLTKKEVAALKTEKEKLEKVLVGVRIMKGLPAAVFIIDPKKEGIALCEAYRLEIPTVALIDTNSDPDMVTYPLPGNDDAIRSIDLICDIIAEVIREGRESFLKARAKEETKEREEIELAKKELEEAQVPQEVKEAEVEAQTALVEETMKEEPEALVKGLDKKLGKREEKLERKKPRPKRDTKQKP